jgi:hypothetical protein
MSSYSQGGSKQLAWRRWGGHNNEKEGEPQEQWDKTTPTLIMRWHVKDRWWGQPPQDNHRDGMEMDNCMTQQRWQCDLPHLEDRSHPQGWIQQDMNMDKFQGVFNLLTHPFWGGILTTFKLCFPPKTRWFLCLFNGHKGWKFYPQTDYFLLNSFTSVAEILDDFPHLMVSLC